MRLTILFLFFITNSFSLSLDDIKEWYQEGAYKKVCSNKVWQTYDKKYKNNEQLLNMYAHSCMKTDMISLMTLPISKLIKTPQTRSNAVYYTTILYQKKLLYHALIDNVDISYVSLPKTGYILSKVFDKYVKKEYTKEKNIYIMKGDEENEIYKLFIEKNKNNLYKMIIQTYKNGTIVKTRLYW